MNFLESCQNGRLFAKDRFATTCQIGLSYLTLDLSASPRSGNDGGMDEECCQERQGKKCCIFAIIKGPIIFYHLLKKVYSLGELRPPTKLTITPCGFDAWDSFPDIIFAVGK